MRSVEVMPDETKNIGLVELELDRGDITGEVVMKDNTPLRDVTASLDLVVTDGGTSDGGTLAPYSAAVAPSAQNPSRGSFTIRDVPIGTWTVKASRDNYITALSGVVDVIYKRAAPAGTLELVRIQGEFIIDDGDSSNTPGFTRTRDMLLKLNGAGNASEWRAAGHAHRAHGHQRFSEGIYSVDVTTPTAPAILGYFPVGGDAYFCRPLGDAVRRIHARITVAGSRAYYTSGGTLRVVDLE